MKTWHIIAASVFCLLIPGCGRDPSPTGPIPGRSAPGREIAPRNHFEPGEVLAVLNPGEDAEAVAFDHELTVDEGLEDGVTYKFLVQPGDDVYDKEAELWADSRVAGACLNYIATDAESRQSSMAFDEGFLEMSEFYDQALLQRLRIPEALSIAQGGGVTVAILDTGADSDHEVLAGKIHPDSYDFIEDDADPADVPDGVDSDGDGNLDEATGHGTHVAGLVTLVAPGATLMILRVLDSDGQGPAFDVARAIEYAASHGAHVINMSLGMLYEPYAVDEALSYAADMGLIMVGSAGNWGSEIPEEYPSSSSDVWAVAASDSIDRAATFTSYSSHVVLSAPGVQVRSAYWNGGYAVWSGTSMSAPLVSGATALLRGLHPEWTPQIIRARLASTVDPVYPIDPEQEGELGAGRLNVGAALAPDAPSAVGGDPGEMILPRR